MDLEQASFEDVRKELEKSGGQMGEVLQRLLKLFERQRLETQRVLSMKGDHQGFCERSADGHPLQEC